MAIRRSPVWLHHSHLLAESEWDPYKRVENDASHTAEVGFPKRDASQLGTVVTFKKKHGNLDLFGICLEYVWIFMNDMISYWIRLDDLLWFSCSTKSKILDTYWTCWTWGRRGIFEPAIFCSAEGISTRASQNAWTILGLHVLERRGFPILGHGYGMLWFGPVFPTFSDPFQSESLLETETGFAQAEKNPLDCNTSPDGGAESFFNRSSKVASANGARARCWLSSRGCQVETRSLTIKSGGWTNTKSLANKCRSEASFTLRWKHLEANNRQQASVSKILLTNMFMIFHGISWFIARFQKCVQTRTCIYDIYVAIILPSWILWQTARFCKTPKYWHKEFGSKRPT